MTEIFMSLLAGIITVGSIGSSIIIRKLLLQFFWLKKKPEESYSERLTQLTSSLTKASAEVDNVLDELTKVARKREKAVNELEDGLSQLEKRKKRIKGKDRNTGKRSSSSS